MAKSDQWVNVILVLLIVIHLSIFVIGFFTSKLAYLTSFLNLVAGVSIILYWGVRQIQIEQHILEFREIMALGFEAVVVGCAVYGIITGVGSNWLKVVQYIFSGIHLLVLILALIFMLTFKMSKLI